MKIWSLRKKITLLVGLITVLACVVLTANSIYSADSYYGEYLKNGYIKKDIPQSIEGITGGKKYEIEPGKSEYMIISRQFSMQSMGMMFVIVTFSLITTYWITGQILNPLVKLTNSIQSINEKNLHERVEISKTTEEVYRLTYSFNGMMDRLEESFSIQKQSASQCGS